MLAKLLPRKTEFFALFSRHAELCVQGARLLAGLLAEPGKGKDGYDRVHALEHEADRVCQETMERLHSTFVTPIDRSDIHELSSRLDDIVDHIEATAQRVWLYEIARPTPEVIEMGANLVRATEALKTAVDALGGKLDAGRTRELCAAVKQVEKENDRVLRRATARLFKEEEDARALIKWKEIYEDVERAVDFCEDVANVIEGVVLENS
jgi:predicted phosphate transport protein (TIGR00153 family)